MEPVTQGPTAQSQKSIQDLDHFAFQPPKYKRFIPFLKEQRKMGLIPQIMQGYTQMGIDGYSR